MTDVFVELHALHADIEHYKHIRETDGDSAEAQLERIHSKRKRIEEEQMPLIRRRIRFLEELRSIYQHWDEKTPRSSNASRQYKVPKTLANFHTTALQYLREDEPYSTWLTQKEQRGEPQSQQSSSADSTPSNDTQQSSSSTDGREDFRWCLSVVYGVYLADCCKRRVLESVGDVLFAREGAGEPMPWRCIPYVVEFVVAPQLRSFVQSAKADPGRGHEEVAWLALWCTGLIARYVVMSHGAVGAVTAELASAVESISHLTQQQTLAKSDLLRQLPCVALENEKMMARATAEMNATAVLAEARQQLETCEGAAEQQEGLAATRRWLALFAHKPAV